MGEPCAESASCWIASWLRLLAMTTKAGSRAFGFVIASAAKQSRGCDAHAELLPWRKNMVFFQKRVDSHILLGLLSTCPVPPRGALEGAQVCGAAEGGAGDAALRLRGFRRVTTPA